MTLVRMIGLGRLIQKHRQIPVALRAALKEANDQSADEFMALVRQVVPRGDPEHGHLAETLRKEAGTFETSVKVTIGRAGDPEANYPLHLEAGHTDKKSGKHVAARPFWNPAKAAMRKRHRSRGIKAANRVMKSFAATGGGLL